MGAFPNNANANAAVQQQRIESNVLTGEQRLVPVPQPTVPTAPAPTKKSSTSHRKRSIYSKKGARGSIRSGIDFGPGRANRIPEQDSPEYEQLLQSVRNLNQRRR